MGRRIRNVIVLMVLAAAAVLTGCSRAADLKQTPFDPKGPVAATQLGVLSLTLYFAIGIGTVVTVALLYVVWRYRARGGEKHIPEQVHGSTRLEIAWTLIPILILVFVAVPTVQAAFATYTGAGPGGNEVRVKVVGNQWWFAFEYPDLGVVTGNELVLPVGKNVGIELVSNDVIHSFWIPKLGGKTDVIPNRLNKMWLKADEEGEYFGQCAEFCGTQHAQMRFRVQVVSQAAFEQWIATRKAGAATPTDPQSVAGKALFEGKEIAKANCLICHTVDGTKAQGKVGPNLSNIGARKTLAAGVVENTDEFLKQWIRNPQSIKPGVTAMPPHPNLSDAELDAIVKYLRGLDK